MSETTTYFWTDRTERAFVRLRYDGSHWRLEWGYRDPPASDHYAQQGEHETSVRQEAVQRLLQQVEAMCTEPDEPVRVKQQLDDLLQAAESEG